MSDKMVDTFKTMEDLQMFCKAQQKTLIELTKKNKEKEDKIKHLEKLLSQTVPVLQTDKPKIEFGANDEESIAREQLFRLKELSHEKELTLEEAKRVEIFSKILIAGKQKPKDIISNGKQLDTKELLKLIE